MSQMFVQIAAPAAGAEVPRSYRGHRQHLGAVLAGHGPLTSKSVHVQFGDGGPVQAATFPPQRHGDASASRTEACRRAPRST